MDFYLDFSINSGNFIKIEKTVIIHLTVTVWVCLMNQHEAWQSIREDGEGGYANLYRKISLCFYLNVTDWAFDRSVTLADEAADDDDDSIWCFIKVQKQELQASFTNPE